jgi:hypothetical protein
VTGGDLDREYRKALRRTELCDLGSLFAAGVPHSVIAGVMPALDTVTVEGAFYQPDPEGGAAFIMPVRVERPITPETLNPAETIADGPIIDLLAMHPRSPARWALRRGAATWLGSCEPQFCGPDIVPIRRTPLDWLRADCKGLVLLSRDRRDQYRVLSRLRAIVAEDNVYAVELREVLAHPWSAPPVTVAKRGRHRAA